MSTRKRINNVKATFEEIKNEKENNEEVANEKIEHKINNKNKKPLS